MPPKPNNIVRNTSAPLPATHHVRHVNPPPHHPPLHHSPVPIPQPQPQPTINRAPRGVEAAPIGPIIRSTNMQRTASLPTPTPVQRFNSNEAPPTKPPRLRAPPGFSSTHQSHDNHMSSPREPPINRAPTAIGHAWHGSTTMTRNRSLGSRADTTPVASSTPSASQWPPMPTVGIGLSRDDPILKTNKVVRGVVYADQLPHEKKQRQASTTIAPPKPTPP